MKTTVALSALISCDLDFDALPNSSVTLMEAMLSKFILMIPKTQVKNQESSKFQESKSRSFKNQDSSKESRYARTIKISIKKNLKIFNITILLKRIFKIKKF